MRHSRYPIRRGPRGGNVAPPDGMPRQAEPPEPRAGDHVGGVTLEWYGRQYVLRFRVPGVDQRGHRSRSDQVCVEIDGAWQRMSLRAALLELERMAPRVMSRKERAGC